MSTTEPTPRVGDVVAGYRLEAMIGSGGMGTVFRASGREMPKVAVKILRRELADDEIYRERFEREVRVAGQLRHPNIVRPLGHGEHNGALYVVMDYVGGHDLRTLLARVRALDPRQTVSIARQVAGALDAAHAVGLVHRDVKPANVLLAPSASGQDAPTAFVTDFGIAEEFSAARAPTASGAFVGTRHYASPEQIDAKPVDGRADQYALGCIAYECLTGKPPYDKESDSAVMVAHLLEAPPSVGSTGGNLPEAVDEVLARALAKAPADRYPSCAAMVEALERALTGGEVVAVPRADVDASAARQPEHQPLEKGDESGLHWPAKPERVERGGTQVLPGALRSDDATPPTDEPGTGDKEFSDAPSGPTPSRRPDSQALRNRLPLLLGVAVAAVGTGLLVAGLVSGGGGETPAAVVGPRARDDTLVLGRGAKHAIAAARLLRNDRGDALRIAGVAGGAQLHGHLTLDRSGRTLVYAPDPSYTGVAHFTYTVRDRAGGLDVGSVSAKVRGFSAEEQRLLSFVPAALAGSCAVMSSRPSQAVASVRCRANVGAVTLTSYRSVEGGRDALEAEYRARPGDCTTRAGTGSWYWPGGDEEDDAGSYGCRVGPSGARFGWTYDAVPYVGEVIGAKGVAVPELRRWFFETVRLKR